MSLSGEECAAAIPVRSHGLSWTVGDIYECLACIAGPHLLLGNGLRWQHLQALEAANSSFEMFPARLQDRTSRIRDINGYTWQLMEVHSSQVGGKFV